MKSFFLENFLYTAFSKRHCDDFYTLINQLIISRVSTYLMKENTNINNYTKHTDHVMFSIKQEVQSFRWIRWVINKAVKFPTAEYYKWHGRTSNEAVGGSHENLPRAVVCPPLVYSMTVNT